jgi:hypothetical protein
LLKALKQQISGNAARQNKSQNHCGKHLPIGLAIRLTSLLHKHLQGTDGFFNPDYYLLNLIILRFLGRVVTFREMIPLGTFNRPVAAFFPDGQIEANNHSCWR